MPLSKEELEASLKVLKSLDEALNSGPWEYNVFFKGVGQKLNEIRNRFIKELGLEEYLAEQEKKHAEEIATSPDFTEVFVSLYQAEGTNFNKWQVVVNSLAGYNVTRPVYQTEEHVIQAIKGKEFRQNDAYVVVKIRKDDIMPALSDKPPVDRFGNPLLVLKEGAIKLENIKRFSHQSGEYLYEKGTLTKQGPSQSF